MLSRMPRIFGALACLIASVSSSSSHSNNSSRSSSESESDGSFAPVYTSRVRLVSQGMYCCSEAVIIDIVPAAPVRATTARRAPASALNIGAPAPTPLSLPAATLVRSGAVRTPAVVRPQSALNRPATSAHTLAHWWQHQVLDVGVYPSWTRLSHRSLAVTGRQCSFGIVALRDTTAPITNIYAFNTQQHQLNGIGSTTANVV
eukprot:12573-Heterococcus_DN1.PRE.3